MEKSCVPVVFVSSGAGVSSGVVVSKSGMGVASGSADGSVASASVVCSAAGVASGMATLAPPVTTRLIVITTARTSNSRLNMSNCLN